MFCDIKWCGLAFGQKIKAEPNSKQTMRELQTQIDAMKKKIANCDISIKRYDSIVRQNGKKNKQVALEALKNKKMEESKKKIMNQLSQNWNNRKQQMKTSPQMWIPSK